MSIPDEIRTERLLLRPSSLDDAEAVFHAWAGDASSCRWLEWEPHAGVAATAAMLQDLSADRDSGAAVDWLAFDLEDGALVGAVRLSWLSAIERDIGFVVARERRRSGLASEMVSAVTAAALRLPEVVRVQAGCHPDNAGSLGVLANCGYEVEGRLRRCRTFPNLGDAAQDLMVLSRLS